MSRKSTTSPQNKPKKSFQFDPAKITFLIGVAFVIVGGVYFVINQIYFPSPITAQTVTGQQVLVPASWMMYTNKLLGFSIAHPASYKAKESTTDLSSAANAGSGGVFSVGFQSGSALAPLGVNVTHQTLDQAVAYAKYNIAHGAEKGKKLTITRDTQLTIDGYPATRIDVHVADGSDKNLDTDFTDIYVSANQLVYNIATDLSGTKPFDEADAQMMYKSFVIKNL